MISEHNNDNNFSIYIEDQFDDKNGTFKFKCIHFQVKIGYLCEKIKGNAIIFDLCAQQIRFKRLAPATVPSSHDNQDELHEECEQFKKVLAVMDKINRRADFLSIVDSLVDGRLSPESIALHLLLDVGQLLRQSTVYSMR